MKCKVCNSELNEGQAFCPYCGTKVEAPMEQSAPAEVITINGEAPKSETKGADKCALIGFIVGIASLVCCCIGFPAGIVGIILSAKGICHSRIDPFDSCRYLRLFLLDRTRSGNRPRACRWGFRHGL